MNGNNGDGNNGCEYTRLKLIERGIDPETGGKLIINRHSMPDEEIKTGIMDSFCTRWGEKVYISKVFSGQETIK